MFKKLTILLLLFNLISTWFVISWTWKVNKDLSQQSEAIQLLVSMQAGDDKFRENTYKGLALLMSGQSQLVLNQDQLNMGILRVHHFAEPHSEQFYKNCPECQKEQADILKTADNND